MSTAYHARYFGHELTRLQPAAGVERISRSLFDACVDLNPHQIDAALFAVRSPLSKGVVLADEVGLGKTIEAGLVMCQSWAERRRRMLVVCPASLRKQWALELEDKFNLPAVVLEARSYRQCVAEGNPTPFDTDRVVIISFHFANRMREEIRVLRWDLAVVDEAHKLRNVYRSTNKIGRGIKWALEDTRKLLLTATPLQNSLLELYGLALLIDDRFFGDLASFLSRFTTVGADLDELKNRLRPFCHRTLRRQVLEYVRYTERRVITRPFRPSDEEHKLYEAVSEFLQRADTYSTPAQQRHLTTLIIRKILASSSHALASTMETLKDRLVKLREGIIGQRSLAECIIDAEDLEDELLDELLDGGPENPDQDADAGAEPEDKAEQEIDRQKLDLEIEELGRYAAWAHGIAVDAKTRALRQALDIGFAEMAKMGAASKALIFTESRRTQRYLHDFLEANGYAGDIVLSIYDRCRTTEEIETAFQALQTEMRASIDERLATTRERLLEHFDEEVHARLKMQLADTRAQLDHVGRMFWVTTRFMLQDRADFDDTRHGFVLRDSPCPDARPGSDTLISKTRDNVLGDFLYRLSHPLGEHVVETAKSLDTPLAHVAFNISQHPARISVIERLKGRSGWLLLQAVAIESFEREEYLLSSAFDDAGESLDSETCGKLFHCSASSSPAPSIPSEVKGRLTSEAERHAQGTIARSLEANNKFFGEEQERLDRWADDMELAVEKTLSDTKAQLKALKRQARQASTTDEQHALQLKIWGQEHKQRRRRQEIFDAEDQIQDKRDTLISALSRRLKQSTTAATIFTIRWSVT